MKSQLTTARITGLLYLGLALTGMFAFLFAQGNIYVEGNAVQTSANLIEKETLARFGIAAELALVGFQALAAVWFYKLFRKKDEFAAGLIAVFGTVNAIVILVATAMWFGALNAALDNQVANAQLLFDLHSNLWAVGNLFFGLWLVPMGYLVRVAKMPRALSWFLFAGGIGYIAAGFATILLADPKLLPELLPLPATVGEFWIIGYLLFKSVKE
jgi:hypothetical protein